MDWIEAVADKKRSPRMAAFPDQIVWGRSPVRIDLAGGSERRCLVAIPQGRDLALVLYWLLLCWVL